MAESLDTTKVVKGYSPRGSIFPHFISSCNIEAHFYVLSNERSFFQTQNNIKESTLPRATNFLE